MLRNRFSLLAGVTLVAGAMLAAAPVGAATARTSPTHATTAPASAARPTAARMLPARPAAGVINAAFNTDSCTGTATGHTLFCLGGGSALATRHVNGLTEVSTGGAWTARAPMRLPAKKNLEIFANEVSCAAGGPHSHVCLMVGEHFNTIAAPAQLAELWTGSWRILTAASPPGTTVSAMDDVSCRGSNFCMIVGEAGSRSRTHGTAELWNGKQLRRLVVPAPASGASAELGGLSCASQTSCVAVGNFTVGKGPLRGYAATWNGQSWKVRTMPAIPGQRRSFLQAVSCPAAGRCVAVGESLAPGTHAFSELLAGGKWKVLGMPKRTSSGLFSVSCPGVSRCFAVGLTGRLSLAESWNGHSWTVHRTPRTPTPFNGTQLLHVSCVSTVRCEAVGSRFNPKNLQRTLAESWNGHSWQIQRTASP
jgi:hypothetical protein